MRLSVSSLIVLTCLLVDLPIIQSARSEDRKPTGRETARIGECAEKNKDDLDAVERNCLFKIVSDPCVNKSNQSNAAMVACYDIELKIWDDLLNATYKKLRDDLDEQQQIKLRDMQKAWIAYRDSTCDFYYDKIQGTMAGPMGAACRTRETARRAVLLGFFSRL
jgi:uncharacterized protein YecT (DUF1311 family)